MIVRLSSGLLVVGHASRAMTGGAFMMVVVPSDAALIVYPGDTLEYIGGDGANGYDFFLTRELELEYRKLVDVGY